jgi:hypothetical protein
MAGWRYTVNLLPEWEEVSSEDDDGNRKLPLKKMIPIIVERFRTTLPSTLFQSVEHLLDQLTALVTDLEDDDVDGDEFDEVFGQIYNWADLNRVWIACQ